MNQNHYLVADLGGTNIRFGLCERSLTNNSGNAESSCEPRVRDIRKYAIRDYEDIKHLIQVYLQDAKIHNNDITGCCIAIAGPIHQDNAGSKVKMTNCDWEISTTDINAVLDIDSAALINDFHAIALSANRLPENGLTLIGEQAPDFSKGPVSVFGPGTGLGAALLVPLSEGSLTVIPTEGGHAGLSARTEDELKMFSYWRNKGCRINREFFVSGNGIERIFEALCVDAGCNDYKELSVLNIQVRGCDGEDALCEKALNIFCSFLGSAAGDQVLCTGSTGGLILAGGILPRFVEFLKRSPFRNRFESKGAMSDYNKNIATALIVEEQPGLIGAAAYLDC